MTHFLVVNLTKENSGRQSGFWFSGISLAACLLFYRDVASPLRNK